MKSSHMFWLVLAGLAAYYVWTKREEIRGALPRIVIPTPGTAL